MTFLRGKQPEIKTDLWQVFGQSHPGNGHPWRSAAEIRSPGHQMRPMNPPGYPRSYRRWSIWRPVDSLGFAEDVLEWKRRDDDRCADIKCPLCLSKMRILFGPFWPFFIVCMVSANYWLADYPEMRQTNQPSTIGGPLGEPGFCIFCSTAGFTNENHPIDGNGSPGFWFRSLVKSMCCYHDWRLCPTIYDACHMFMAHSDCLWHIVTVA